jgi:hypothetical protein
VASSGVARKMASKVSEVCCLAELKVDMVQRLRSEEEVS